MQHGINRIKVRRKIEKLLEIDFHYENESYEN